MKTSCRLPQSCETQIREAFFIVSGTESAATQEYRRRLERLIQQLGLSDRVRLIGRMEDISELYCALDVFVSASHSESFGLAIVEAMAAGAAVVATDTDGSAGDYRRRENWTLDSDRRSFRTWPKK